MEIATAPLSRSQIEDEVVWISELFHQMQIRYLIVMFGFGCNLPVDDLWKKIGLKTSDLVAFIKESADAGLYSLGDDDFYIQDPSETYNFRLDHESNIYLSSDDLQIAGHVQNHWLGSGISVHSRSEKNHGWTRMDPP